MEKEIVDLLLKTPLFSGASRELLRLRLSKKAKTKHYLSEETVSPSENGEKHLVIIIKGCAKVMSLDVERRVLLRTLSVGDAFGVAELFGESQIISRVEAKGKCSALFIPESEMRVLLEKDKQIMYNYLSFLCCRIRFLNKRIACFTAGSAERRLAFYLDSLAEEHGIAGNAIKVESETSMGSLALMLDIGRASLYRAIDTLTADGFIEKDGKGFLLKDRDKMLKNYSK